MNKILVPVKDSEFSQAALQVADRFAQRLDAEIVLVTVGELPETSDQAAQQGHDLAQMLGRVAETISSPVRGEVQPAGDPVRGIIEVAEHEDVEMIVMSTHSPSGLEELAQGSTALELVRTGKYPVMLVPPGKDV